MFRSLFGCVVCFDVHSGRSNYMMEQLEPGEAPAADGGCGGTTILAKRPFTFSYVSPVVVAAIHVRSEEKEKDQWGERGARHYLGRKQSGT